MLKMTSIKAKLTAIGMATTGMALLAASIVLVVHEALSFRSSLVSSLTVQADMIGGTSTVALSFHNHKDATEILDALKAAPAIVQAAIYAKNGGIFAVYNRAGGNDRPPPSSPPSENTAFGWNELSLVRPILLDQERIGSIYLRSDLREFYTRMLWYAGIAALAFAGSLALAYLLLSRLQRTITAPILELVRLTKYVSREKDYSMRCAAAQEDETGSLAAGFNEMLKQIQIRDWDLARHRENLEETVALRTAELSHMNERLHRELTERRRTEEQLRHSQRMESVGRLSGGVAHDFNNILTAIIGYGTLVQMKLGPGDPLRHNIDEILAAASRAAALTQSLLAFSRKQVMNARPVDLVQVIERVGKLLQRLIGEDVALTRSHADKELVVVADSGQMEQVLMNLSTNARDAMPQGGRLSIETRRVALDERYIATHAFMKPGAYALITVSDTGIGMDVETACKIFEPFFTTKESGKGTGLGLSIVHGIVKQHGGYINVYSEPGHGTAFKIYLPLSEAKTILEQQRPMPDIKRGTETILLAEDDEALRKLMRTVIEDAGYRVLEAADGQEAVDAIRLHKDEIKLFLLDVIMPKKSGREVYEEGKDVVPGVKTLFVSGYTAEVIHAKGLIGSGLEVVTKPIAPGELLGKIRATLDA